MDTASRSPLDRQHAAIKRDHLSMGSVEIVNALSAHVAVIARDGTIVAINEAWQRFALANEADSTKTGVGANYLTACRRAIDPDNYASAFDALHGIEQVLAGRQQEFELEYPCHAPNAQRWFLMRVTPLGQTSHAVICHINITGQKLAEERLARRDAELEAHRLIHRAVTSQIELEPVIDTILLEISRLLKPDLAMLFLKDGDRLVLRQSCPAPPDSFCHNGEDHQIGECLCGLSVELRSSVFSSDITTDPRCSRNECKEAGYRSFASIPLISGNQVLGCIGLSSKATRNFSDHREFLETTADDITLGLKNALLYDRLKESANDLKTQLEERQRLEEVIVQNQKLEAIGHLAGGIAHDFNNILAAIMGFSELALRRTDEQEIREYLENVLKASNRAKDLIQQILTFSRKSEANLAPVDLRRILKDTLPLVRASLASNITILDRFDEVADATILGNSTQLQRVLLNLCANGAQAMRGSGGMLIVKLTEQIADELLRERCPELALGRRYLVLSVRDTGTGISPEHLHSIFEPYFTTKTQEKGTGLGLAVVHGIVKHHAGNLLVKSFVDHGTTFSIFFPPCEESVSTSPPTPNAARAIVPAHILAVDDEPAILLVLKKSLEKQGYTVTCSQFAREAITLFRKAPESFDLLLCDLTMPEMSGDALARKFKEVRADIPVILCSGHSPELMREIDTSHVDQLLQKPIPQEELARALRKALDGIKGRH